VRAHLHVQPAGREVRVGIRKWHRPLKYFTSSVPEIDKFAGFRLLPSSQPAGRNRSSDRLGGCCGLEYLLNRIREILGEC
jgi:hypothetical protein